MDHKVAVNNFIYNEIIFDDFIEEFIFDDLQWSRIVFSEILLSLWVFKKFTH